MSVFELKLHMMVIVKDLLLLYNLEPWNIHEAWNAKKLYVFENSALSGPFFVQYATFL